MAFLRYTQVQERDDSPNAGAQISALQMSMYIWSILGTVFCLWALKQIRDVIASYNATYIQEQPIKMVVYAYFFVVDFIVNVLYTVLFASIWFLIVADSDRSPLLGSKTFDSLKDATGFVHPVHTSVTKVHVIATPLANPLRGQHGDIVPETGPVSVGSPGSSLSTVSLIFFWSLKLYFILVVFAYARSLILRNRISAASVPSNGTLGNRAQKW